MPRVKREMEAEVGGTRGKGGKRAQNKGGGTKMPRKGHSFS